MTPRDYILLSAWFIVFMSGALLAFCGTSLTAHLVGLAITAVMALVFAESGTFKAIGRKIKDKS